MRIKYFPATLSRDEQTMFNIIADVEREFQSWFVVGRSRLLREELIINIQ